MKLIGHRGAKDEWPENTLLGFEKAIESGVHGLEIDVHKTQDGQLVVVHDPSLERTTTGQGKIKELTLNEVKTFDAGKGQKVPTLDEVIELIKSHDILLFIEAKALNIEQEIVNCVQKHQAHQNIIVISFNHHTVKKIKELDSQIRTGCLIEATPIEPVRMVQAAKADLLVVASETITKSMVQDCHQANIEVGCWCANTKEQYNELTQLHIDYLMTDRPSLIGPLL